MLRPERGVDTKQTNLTSTPRVKPRRLRMFESLRHRDFRYLWVTSFLSASARNLQQVSLGFLAFDLTGSSVLLGTVLFVYQIPFLSFALLVGVLADRVNRKRLLAISQFGMAAFAVALAVDIALGWVETWHLIVFAFISGIENTIIHIVRQALVPRVVPRESLLNAVSLNTTGFNVSRIIAPAVGGVLIVAVGVAGNFGIQAALLIGVAFASLPMRVGKAEGATERTGGAARGMAADLVEILRYVWREPLLRQLFLVQYVVLFFTVPYLGFLPVWTEDVLRMDADILGVLYVATGAGAVVGTLWLAQRVSLPRRGLWLIATVAINAVGLIGLSQVDGLALTIVVLAFLGAAQVMFFALNISAAQAIIPDALQGRAMAVWNMGHGGIALGTLIMGYVVAAAGVQDAMWLMGVPMLALTVLGAAALRRIRELD